MMQNQRRNLFAFISFTFVTLLLISCHLPTAEAGTTTAPMSNQTPEPQEPHEPPEPPEPPLNVVHLQWEYVDDTMFVILFLLLVCLVTIRADTTISGPQTTRETPEPPLGVVAVQWDYVRSTVLVILFLLVVCTVSMVVRHIPYLAEIIPETCILILIGVAMAELFKVAGDDLSKKTFSNKIFMLYMLPPIVLDAAYGLNSRTFAANIGTILLQAVFGTLVNFLIIGPALYGLFISGAMGTVGRDLSLVDCFMFASFIVAVDPVAVIAIFKDVGVNDMLYFLVFGESLLNDAVTVVIYDMMANFITQTEIPGTQIAMGVAFFIVSSVGGAAIGLALGLLTSVVTKYTYKVPGAEPITVLLMAYMSYLLAMLLEWSGIIALTTCGIIQAQFAFPNISYESEVTVKKMIEVLGNILEAFVFLILGGEIIDSDHLWSVGFIMWSILLILVCRAVSIFGLTFLANCFRRKKVDLRSQFIMWYGGLRGALAFVLCATLSESYGPRSLFLTTTIIVILFTVFIQGISMRPIVNMCKVEMKNKGDPPFFHTLADMMEDHLMAGMEVVCGKPDWHYVREQGYMLADKSKKYLSKYHSTYATALLESCEEKDFHEIEEIRTEQPHETCPCCAPWLKRSSSSSSSLSSRTSKSSGPSIPSILIKTNSIGVLDDETDMGHDNLAAYMEMSHRRASAWSHWSYGSTKSAPEGLAKIRENGNAITSEKL